MMLITRAHLSSYLPNLKGNSSAKRGCPRAQRGAVDVMAASLLVASSDETLRDHVGRAPFRLETVQAKARCTESNNEIDALQLKVATLSIWCMAKGRVLPSDNAPVRFKLPGATQDSREMSADGEHAAQCRGAIANVPNPSRYCPRCPSSFWAHLESVSARGPPAHRPLP